MKKVVSLIPYLKKAEKLVANGPALQRLLTDAQDKAQRHEGRIQEFWTNLKLLTRMVQAWFKGEYRALPWKSLMGSMAALIYFVNPFDLLPDVILFGFVDDALVVGFVLSSFKTDIQAFSRWYQEREKKIS